MSSMKIGLYSPYFPKHFGGGEKHFLTSAWYLSQKHKVEVLIPTGFADLEERIKRYEELFSLNLSKITFVPSPLADNTSSPLETWKITRRYSAFMYLTDGSLFLSGAKRNILHIQFPFTQKGKGLFPFKLRSWTIKNANSEFTKNVVEKSWQTRIPFIHYPYVRLPESSVLNKKRDPIILAVGRFIDPEDNVGHSKRQDILIEAFRQGRSRFGWEKWQLILVGSVEPGSTHQRYVEKLQLAAKDLPVTFLHDIPDADLTKLYQESTYFWHGAGYGVNETTHPLQVEHFGMSTVEAMGHGLIPIVMKNGGLKEIIDEPKNGYFFTTTSQLVQQTQLAMHLSANQTQKIQQLAYKRASDFTLEKFCSTLDEMLEKKV
jgi:glycosyltransferase involved in cell wall biosynthesis